jgi:hypothetical protein
MMAVSAQVVPREHGVPKLAEASCGSRPVSPEHPEGVELSNPLEFSLDERKDSHNLPPVEAVAALTIHILPRLPAESCYVFSCRTLLTRHDVGLYPVTLAQALEARPWIAE